MSEHALNEVVDQVDDITQTVWATLFDVPLERREPGSLPRAHRSITACVQITGPSEVAVTVACSTELGKHIAGKFFEVPEQDASLEEVRDAMGEVANMVGGNLKGMLPGPSRLSLPAVTEGADYTVDIRGAEVVRTFSYLALEESLTVTVLRREDEAKTHA